MWLNQRWQDQVGRVKRISLLILILVGSTFMLLRFVGKSLGVEQPIAFNHKIHVEKQIDCTFCHQYVKSQAVAGLPSVQLCLTCHSALPTRTGEIQKIFAYAEKQQEIPWVRVYQLPPQAYVVFNHKRHIAANISCNVCHGDVARMGVAERVVSHTMGWCVDCHKQNESAFPLPRLATDCWTCHK